VSLKSFIGSRKGLMTLLIAFLLMVVLWIKSKASGAAVTGVPSDLRQQLALAFSSYDYKNMDNWLAISKMETAGWTSGLYNQGNNPWGMGYPSKRPTRASGKYLGTSPGQGVSFNFAQYATLEDASADLLLYMDYVKFPKGNLSLREHVQAMGDRGYFGTETVDSYYNKVMAWLTR